ncbi:hypothetical protein CDV31_004738 [Fusarium ambrosium]|uniref:F-box domain-containing protein n=1 Tax=Fusarium ambrosium TaxID=131363 RepID=A0A428UNE0_9HYPO|nr:hypothetical protein CDV31_004738 [Fusarium ambrosium]
MSSIKLSIRSPHDTQPGTATLIMSEAHSRLLEAPMEVHQHILSSLPDIPSLAAAALSCRQLYAAFTNTESALVHSVLTNCIGTANLPEALITHRCSPPYPSSNHVEMQPGLIHHPMDRQCRYISSFLRDLDRSNFEDTPISMAEALIINDFHVNTVLPLAQRFVVICTERCEWQKPLWESIQERPVSQTEWGRIERVLYRFEMFRRLFGRFDVILEELMPFAKSFFRKFAPWENAQLGCIYDFLATEVRQVYLYVAEHDIVWGAYRIALNNYGPFAIQHLLTMGLSKILEISRSETFEDKSKLVGGGEPICRSNRSFLLNAFKSIWDPCLGNKKAAKAMRKLPPFFDDGEIGPERTWRRDLEKKVYHFATYPYFEWGCVMWDADRMDDLVIEEVREESPWLLFDNQNQEDSCGTRFDLYELGHRGYWAPDDGSSS